MVEKSKFRVVISSEGCVGGRSTAIPLEQLVLLLPELHKLASMPPFVEGVIEREINCRVTGENGEVLGYWVTDWTELYVKGRTNIYNAEKVRTGDLTPFLS